VMRRGYERDAPSARVTLGEAAAREPLIPCGE
jgi:hypothetical protein